MKITGNNNPTIQYATDELEKYLLLICSDVDNINIQLYVDEFDVDNKDFDDVFAIKIIKNKGYIKGSNERSILLGVYKLLYELGCRWIRPSLDGEIIPKRDIDDINVVLFQKASYRHRGIVIEGGNSYKNVFDIIEWLPKLGYNSYFIQFQQAYTFFEKWYKHDGNPTIAAEDFDIETATKFTRQLENEIKKRGLIYHAVGHGWTSESIGIAGLGWNEDAVAIEAQQIELLAQIDGQREFWHNIPMNTNLCYSNPQVQEKMTDYILEYLKNHTNIDMLHVWLADEFNNHCECSECSKKIPTDFYIQILNKLDVKLTNENIDTKIVLLQYFELLWPPQTEHIKNQNRFLYMFAPISRIFSKSFKNMELKSIDIPKYERNKIVLPKKLEENVVFLKQWQKQLQSDCFDFDYHLGRAHYGDLGYYHISRIIYEDIQALHKLGLNGLLSCQEQRCFFPTGLPNYVMGLTLWNSDLAFEDIVQDYFSSAFGLNAESVKDYLQTLSTLSDIDYWHARKEWYMPELAENFHKIEKVVKDFEVVINENIEINKDAVKKSWEYLKYHMNYSILFSKSMAEKCKGNDEKANEFWTEFVNYIRQIELNVQPVLDVYRIVQIARVFVKLKIQE